MKVFRSAIFKTITSSCLILIMVIGMMASLGKKAEAATPINIAYAAGTDATINGGPVLNINAFVDVETSITTVKPIRKTSGFNFAGWSEQKDSGIIKYKSGEKVTFKKAQTLYPVWQINLAFGAGSGARINGNNQVLNVSTYVGKSTIIPSIKPEKSGYIFKGWTDDKGGTSVKYYVGNSYKFYKPTGFYPIWEKAKSSYSIKFWYGNDYYLQTYKYGSTITLADPKFQKSGYELKGWATKSGGAKVYSRSQSITPEGDINLYPVWEKTTMSIQYVIANNCTVSGVNGNSWTERKTVSDKVTSKVPTYKNGEKFVGWSLRNPHSTDSSDRAYSQYVFTSADNIQKVLDKLHYSENNSLILYAVYCGKNEDYRLGTNGYIWHDKAGNVALYLTGAQAKELAQNVADYVKSNQTEAQMASDAELNFYITLIKMIVPSKIDDFILDWVQHDFLTAYKNAGLRTIDKSFQTVFDAVKVASPFKKVWKFIKVCKAFYKANENNDFKNLYDQINKLYKAFQDAGAYDSAGKAKNLSKMSISIYSGKYQINEFYENYMLTPPGVNASVGTWVSPDKFDFQMLKVIFSGGYR